MISIKLGVDRKEKCAINGKQPLADMMINDCIVFVTKLTLSFRQESRQECMGHRDSVSEKASVQQKTTVVHLEPCRPLYYACQ